MTLTSGACYIFQQESPFLSSLTLANQNNFFQHWVPKTAQEPWYRQGLQKSPGFYFFVELTSCVCDGNGTDPWKPSTRTTEARRDPFVPVPLPSLFVFIDGDTRCGMPFFIQNIYLRPSRPSCLLAQQT